MRGAVGAAAGPGFSGVTEIPGVGASAEQLAMLYTRYRWASRSCHGKAVVEVACGAGLGLGYLARTAARVLAGDIDPANLALAAARRVGRPPVLPLGLDAERLPFRARCLDVVILFEAIYYLANPGHFLDECRRVLRPEGAVLICSANPERPDFLPSPLSRRYFAARELAGLLDAAGFDPETFVGFPLRDRSARDRLTMRLRLLAGRRRLVPATMRGKRFLKRLFYGRLSPVPREVTDDLGPGEEPVVLGPGVTPSRFKVVYWRGRLRE